MSQFQKIIKYLALAFAIFLIITIASSIMYGITFIASIFSDDDTIMTNMETTKINSIIKNLNIEIGGANLIIQTGDDLKIENNNKYINIKETNNTLTIKEENHNWFIGKTNDSQVIITIPQDYTFNKVALETGAGKLEIENLTTDKLDLELGAGKVSINNLLVENKIDIDGGAGEIVIKNSTLNDLDLDMGVGRVELTSSLLGNSDIDAGVGELNINLPESKDDYRVKIKKGVGDASINGESIKDNKTYGNGSNLIDIDGGVGSIKINFDL